MEPKGTKHGSQKRERQARAICFVNAPEKAAIEAKAARAGLSVSGYLRALIFGKDAPQPRGARRPVVEKELLVRLLGEIGKIGSNINQIAHVANQGRGINFPVLEKLSSEIVVMRQQVKAALGREELEAPDPPQIVALPSMPSEPERQKEECSKVDEAARPVEEGPPLQPPSPALPERSTAPLSSNPVKGPSFLGKLFGGGHR